MAKILYASQWFPPENVRSGLQIAHDLRERGHHVEVLTGFPNYPNGRIYPGYRLRPYLRERIEEIDVHRVFLIPSHSRSSLGRMANYFSFCLSVFLFLIWAGRRFDIIYVYHPPITVGLAAALAGVLTRRPFILEVQDLWPDSVGVSGMSGTSLFARLLRPMCRFTYRRAAVVIGQSQAMTARLIERGVSARRAMTNFNWADENSAKANGRFDVSTLGFEGRFNFVFGGNIGRAQGLETVVHAALAAAREDPRVLLTLIGGGVERAYLQALVEELGAQHCVQFRPAVPVEEIGDIFSAADVLLVHLLDDPLFGITIPSKTQFYLAMGKPILIGVQGEAAAIVTDAGAGIAVAPQNVAAMTQAMLAFARMPDAQRAEMGLAGRRAYDRHYSMATAFGRIADAVNRALPAKGPVPAGGGIKRAFDILISLVALIVLAPTMAIVALLIRVQMGGPVLFRQCRPGLNGKPFEMIKFRTMRDALGADGKPLPDSERLTRLGAFLRKSSLDELPELWNVLIGDMSLVGPRPLLMEYLPRYTTEQFRRHEVRPGITGLAQVKGRNAISWEDKFNYDLFYVDNCSFVLDVKIIFMTILKILKASDVNSSATETMPKFTGKETSPPRSEQ